MGESWIPLREAIAIGIPENLPAHPGCDDSVDHAPARRQVLTDKQKKLALKNALNGQRRNILSQLRKNRYLTLLMC